jgi:hypothetical protein
MYESVIPCCQLTYLYEIYCGHLDDMYTTMSMIHCMEKISAIAGQETDATERICTAVHTNSVGHVLMRNVLADGSQPEL